MEVNYFEIFLIGVSCYHVEKLIYSTVVVKKPISFHFNTRYTCSIICLPT